MIDISPMSWLILGRFEGQGFGGHSAFFSRAWKKKRTLTALHTLDDKTNYKKHGCLAHFSRPIRILGRRGGRERRGGKGKDKSLGGSI